MRDMKDIAKCALILHTMIPHQLKLRNEFEYHLNLTQDRMRHQQYMWSMLEGSDGAWKAAAKSHILALIERACRYRIDNVQDGQPPAEITLGEIKAMLDEEFKYLSPFSKSSSPTVNLMEKYQLEAVRDWMRRGTNAYNVDWFYRAQMRDPEFVAWDAARALQRSKEREIEEGRLALEEQAKKKKIFDARKEIKKLQRGNVALNKIDFALFEAAYPDFNPRDDAIHSHMHAVRRNREAANHGTEKKD